MSKDRTTVPAKRVRPELLPEQSPALLQELHLLTRGGDLNADARRKLKQINHLCGMLAPALDEMLAKSEAPLLVDAGAGNGYLAFVLYELFLRRQGRGDIVCVEVRPELVARGNERAERLGFARLRFVHAPVASLLGAAVPAGEFGEVPVTFEGRRIDAVVALHACDTATDDAIALGILAETPLVAVVPCCQAEVARLLAAVPAHTDVGLGQLWRHPMHRREFGAHLTNVVRALALESQGYQVTVTELTGWEHSLKNELILARKHQRGNGAARTQLRKLLEGLPPLPMQLLATLGLTADAEPGRG